MIKNNQILAKLYTRQMSDDPITNNFQTLSNLKRNSQMVDLIIKFMSRQVTNSSNSQEIERLPKLIIKINYNNAYQNKKSLYFLRIKMTLKKRVT